MPISPDHPALSIIIPMYQSGPTVRATIESALADADSIDGGAEIIVVNDGSTDDGPAIVRHLAHNEPRITLVHRTNGGLAAARNTGITHARSGYPAGPQRVHPRSHAVHDLTKPAGDRRDTHRWLRFLDADDLALPGSSARLIAYAESRALSAACAPHELIDEHGLSLGRICPAQAAPDGTIGLSEFLEGNRCGVGTVLLRADALGRERFDESLRVCEDWDLWLRLSAAGHRFAACPGEPALKYRVRRASLSKDFGAMVHIGGAALQRAYRRARENPVPDVNASAAREAGAMHALALRYATMHALAPRPNRLDEAAAMFIESGGRQFDATQAADGAFWAALLGLGIRPENNDEPARLWLERTWAWWSRCIAMGWLAESEIDRATRLLASMIPPPAEIARTCVAQATASGQRDIILIGAGENGRMILHAASAAGLHIELRDDRFQTGALNPASIPGHALIRPIDAPIAPDRPVIVSMLNDVAVLARLGGSGPVQSIRWSLVRAELSRPHEARIRQAARNRASTGISPEPAQAGR